MNTTSEAYALALHAMVEESAAANRPVAARAHRFGYDAVENRGRRKPVSPVTRSEDWEMHQAQRRQLVSGTRDLPRNFTVAAWAVRKHLDYVSDFQFQPRTGNPDLDDELVGLMEWWARPVNCDVAARHSLPRLVRMCEERRVVDGDVLVNLVADGRLQVIEGDRCRTPAGGIPDGLDASKLTHGVYADDFGKAIAYVICRRPWMSSDLVFDRLLSARFTRQLGYFNRIDQVRGVSLLAPAVNTMRDIYENIDYAMAKSKLAQMLGLTFYRAAEDPVGLVGTDTAAGDGDADGDGGEQGPKYKVDMGRGPWMLDLDPGDRAEIHESATPPTQFQEFMREMIPLALKALDIPACFYDEGRANFSSGRQGWILYDQSAKSKRRDLRELLDYVTAWRVGLWIASGDLVLPKGFKVRDVRWEWIHAGVPWIDPLKEVTSDVMQINSGLTSRQRVCKERGDDFFTIVDELAEEKKYLATKGITLTETPVSVSVGTDSGAGGNQQQDNNDGN